MRPLPARTLLAVCERAGYRLEEARRLSRRYVVDVLQHETHSDGRLYVEPAAPPDRERELREFFLRRKWPAWYLERKVREVLKR